MTAISKKRFSDKYLAIQDTYEQISKAFQRFEEGDIPTDQLDTLIERALNEIKIAQSNLKRLNIKDIEGEYDEVFIDDIQKHITFFKDAFSHFYDSFTGAKLYDEIIDSVKLYIKGVSLSPKEYERYAETEDQLAGKFTAMLIKHVDTFKNQMKRIAVGTMSQREFNKIYHTNYRKMIPSYTFESFNNY